MTLALVLVSISIFLVVLVVDFYTSPCKHENWAYYKSKGCRQCIDCGEVEKL